MTQVVWALVICWGLVANPTCHTLGIYDTDMECVYNGITVVDSIPPSDIEDLHSVYCERQVVTDA